eukprot:TRINITY_DN11170_c0_g1_i4.p1 TRINITY_DN11170_c0_g1~~TRINITY_DN11170_c0_g1_i4.p1  ORF type:complete len:192 (-),score=-15.87 TRINITY_DN11170_c0_g1_i4:407-982(-)
MQYNYIYLRATIVVELQFLKLLHTNNARPIQHRHTSQTNLPSHCNSAHGTEWQILQLLHCSTNNRINLINKSQHYESNLFYFNKFMLADDLCNFRQPNSSHCVAIHKCLELWRLQKIALRKIQNNTFQNYHSQYVQKLLFTHTQTQKYYSQIQNSKKHNFENIQLGLMQQIIHVTLKKIQQMVLPKQLQQQ